MDQKIFFIFLIIFLVTSEFYLMIRNIIVNGFYLFVSIYILKIVSPDMSLKIKSFLNATINTDGNSIMEIVSNTIKYIKSKFNINKLIDMNKLIDIEKLLDASQEIIN